MACGSQSPTDSCCGKTSRIGGSESKYSNNAKKLDGCQTSCGGGPSKATPETSSCEMNIIQSNDSSCPQSPAQDCKDSCCDEPENPEKEDPNNPSCCKDKVSPCCDVSCLDRIALRECSKGNPVLRPNGSLTTLSSCENSICQITDGAPCESHRRSARIKYATTLEALGCICRALLALGQESCCAPPRRSSYEKRRSTESSRSMLRASVDSCCEKTGPLSEKRRSGSPKKRGGVCSSGCCGKPETSTSTDRSASTTKKSDSLGTCSKGCCGGSGPPVTTKQCASSIMDKPSSPGGCSTDCCSKPQASGPVEQGASATSGAFSPSDGSSDCCGRLKSFPCASTAKGKPNACSAGCCTKSKALLVSRQCASTGEKSSALSEKIEVLTDTTRTVDLEKGNSGKEHVILSISGMTCTGCETKLNRTLGTLQSVKNLKTSLVLSRAEFDLDLGVQTLPEVFKYLERTTEFKYEKVTGRGSSVDIIVTDAAEFMKQDWPRGVTEMTIVDNQTINVAFDAKVAGARDLVEHGWDRPLTLSPARADPTLEAGNKHVRHVGYTTLLSIFLTIPVLVLAWAPLPKREIAYGSASLALATIVQIVIAGPFYPKALKALVFSRIIEMDLLIVLSTSAAYIFSIVSFGYLVAGRPLSTGEFFETSTLLVTLIMVGRYVAALARQKAVASISLRSLQTATATLVDESGANERELDYRLLQYGDIFKVVPDSKIPTDGIVIAGSSEVDESMVTGESTPVEKFPRSAAIAGAMNGSGTLIVKLTRLPAENTISVIAGMVDQAKLSKPKIQNIADRVASYFVPVVVALTIVTFAIWIAVGTAVRNQSGSKATTEAITYAITVLIVSCPCAIGLAVPMVIVIASGVAAERGIIFKAADSIEVAWKTSHVVFDKTGTLTQGKLTVTVEHIEDKSPSSMSLLLGLIGSNKHPISAAVATHLKEKGILATAVSDAKVLTGKGVESTAPGLLLRAGNSRWLNLSSNPQVKSVLKRGYTAFCFTISDSLAAVFGLEDSLRPDALETVTKLQEQGISVHLLSGDDNGPVRSIATQLQISNTNIRSRCTPSDKQAYIQTLLSPTQNKKNPVVIFVGDGTNDAIALAQSTIGIHMNQETGTDVAKSAADVVLMRPSLSGILTMIAISRKAVHRIKFNFGWSFVYNLFAILLGAGAFVDARIPPQFAGLGELVSVLPVVVAAVLLRWVRI
ncbi:E1-E2 ATPase-domain-containing protein [Aspergillus cavernicola]|uniref:E1-E2 ATPase-domain-containing protein n=1 Tax=Aspergillus cavernicola TaxID=176166 RepID=A0ABR4IHW3_9EURO